jgi:DNA-binding response OmpR family regulator
MFPDHGHLLPRFREAGEVTLDLFHSDGRVDAKWLGFHPREFELLWRLAQEPGRRVSKRQLLADAWHGRAESDTYSVAVHIERIRARLEPLGLARLVASHPDGGYSLNAPETDMLFASGMEA